MTFDEIVRLASLGESDALEFKKSTAQLSGAAATLCAFLNGRGGMVLIGVTPSGRIVGQHVADQTQQEVAAHLRKFEPPPTISLEFIDVPGGSLQTIVLRVVQEANGVPFTYDGRAYERIGTATSQMPQERYQRLLVQRLHSTVRWDNSPASGVSLDDLDHEEIRRTAYNGVAAGRLPASTGSEVTDILMRLGLIANGRVLNAAVVLFGKRFLPDYPQCQLRMARFKGLSKTEFIDNRQLHGQSFELLDEAMLFLQRHLPVAGHIEPGLFERVDEPLFPPAALREALVNAFCHRDYTHASGAVSLAIYDDRLEIWSEGALPDGLTVEDLKRDHLSRPPNPLIADTFYHRGLVERWGRGTQLIVELCVRAGHPEPEFIEQTGTVGVRFLPSAYIAPYRVAHELTDRQRLILSVLAQSAALPLREILTRLDSPPAERTAQTDLEHLRRLGLIEAGGHGRGARYWLRRER